MLRKIIALALIPLLLHPSVFAADQPQSSLQTPAQMQNALRKGQNRDKPVKVVLNQPSQDRKKIIGKVSEISDVGFIITDRKTGSDLKLEYANVREIKQTGFSKGWTIALIAVAGLVVVVVIATRPWRSE